MTCPKDKARKEVIRAAKAVYHYGLGVSIEDPPAKKRCKRLWRALDALEKLESKSRGTRKSSIREPVKLRLVQGMKLQERARGRVLLSPAKNLTTRR